MLKKTLLVIFFIIISVITCFVYTTFIQKQNIRHINIKQVFDKFEYTIKLKQDLQKVMDSRQRISDSLEMELKLLSESLRTNNNKELIESFNIKKEYFLNARQEFLEDNQALTKKYDDQIYLQLNQYLKEFGEKNNYDYILSDNEDIAKIAYTSVDLDITDEAIHFINERYKGNIK